MLIVVLVLVLVALGLLVVSLVLGNGLFAWLSIVASVLAAVALLLDIFRRRGGRRGARADGGGEVAAPGPAAGAGAVATEQPTETDADTTDADTTDVEPGGAEPVSGTETGGAAAGATVAGGGDAPDGAEAADELDDVEPGEEETDAADLLTVTDLDDQVVVVDERPRYHLGECRWLGERATIPLPAREARDLGFTPCAVCTPDRVLAGRSRASR